MMYYGLVLVFTLASGCGTHSNRAEVKNTSSTPFNKTFAPVQTKMKIRSLERRAAERGLKPEETAALSALKNGGSEAASARAAELTAKKYTAAGLTEDELVELKLVKQGVAPEQARLEIKRLNKTISDDEEKQLLEMKFGKAPPAGAPALPTRHVSE